MATYLDRLQAIQAKTMESAQDRTDKTDRRAFVSFVSTPEAHFQKNEAGLNGAPLRRSDLAQYDEQGLLTPDSILAMIAEVDQLIVAWCQVYRASDDILQQMLSARKRLAPMQLPGEIDVMRAELADITVIATKSTVTDKAGKLQT